MRPLPPAAELAVKIIDASKGDVMTEFVGLRPKCRLCGLEDGACICAHVQPSSSDIVERHQLETITAFTMRRIRAEIIEECAKVAEAERLTDNTGMPEDAGYNSAVRHIADAIRAMAVSSKERDTP